MAAAFFLVWVMGVTSAWATAEGFSPPAHAADKTETFPNREGEGTRKRECSATVAQSATGCAMPGATPLVKRVLEGVNFDNDQARLRPDATATLDQTAANLKQWGDIKVEVGGHSDSRGSDAHNRDLSQRRADAVRNYLIDQGVAAGRLTARGYSESSPVAGNRSAADRAQNRRVELVPIR